MEMAENNDKPRTIQTGTVEAKVTKVMKTSRRREKKK